MVDDRLKLMTMQTLSFDWDESVFLLIATKQCFSNNLTVHSTIFYCLLVPVCSWGLAQILIFSIGCYSAIIVISIFLSYQTTTSSTVLADGSSNSSLCIQWTPTELLTSPHSISLKNYAWTLWGVPSLTSLRRPCCCINPCYFQTFPSLGSLLVFDLYILPSCSIHG